MIAKFGLEEADQVIPNWEVEHMSEIIASERTRNSLTHGDGLSNFSETETPPQPTPPITPPQPQQENIEMTESEKTALARAEAAEAELAQLKAGQAKATRDASHQANADFAEGLVKGGKLKPAHKDMVAQVLDFMTYPDDTTADFGEGDSKKPLTHVLRDFLSSAPVSHLFGEVATGGAGSTHQHADFAEADVDALAHHNRATALAKSEGISYEAAARRTASS